MKCFRIVSALGVLSLAITTQASAAFSDVSSSHTYATSIAYVESEGIVSGYGDGTFKPNASINRAEFLKIVMASTWPAGYKSAQCPSMPFIDVPTNAWFSTYICDAKMKNVISGNPDGTFRPASTINFAEAAKIIALAYALPTGGTDGQWFEPYIQALRSKNALPSNFSTANKLVTRGEMAFMIHRIKVPLTAGGECKVAGCSGQLCVEEGDDGISTCEWRDEYACYQDATCERQTSGECGWTDTAELRSCLGGDDAASCAAVLCPVNTTCRRGECIPLEDEKAGTYGNYSASVIGNGETSVLFFYASWCPYCQQDDALLEDWYQTQSFDRSVYKVNYDTETALKAKYGVTYQHTYVVIDGEGEMITKVTTPSDAKLEELLNN